MNIKKIVLLLFLVLVLALPSFGNDVVSIKSNGDLFQTLNDPGGKFTSQGQSVYFSTTSSANKIPRMDGSGKLSLGMMPAGVGAPFLDTTTLLNDSVDVTKTFTIKLDAITSHTNSEMNVPPYLSWTPVTILGNEALRGGKTYNGATLSVGTTPSTEGLISLTETPGAPIGLQRIIVGSSAGDMAIVTSGSTRATFPPGNYIVASVGHQLKTSSDDTISGGSTVNLSGTKGPQVDITGSTTINSISGLTSGRELILRFTGASTLTTAGNLVLLGSGNITTNAGDSYVAIGGSSTVSIKPYEVAAGSSAGSFKSLGVAGPADMKSINIQDAPVSSLNRVVNIDNTTNYDTSFGTVQGINVGNFTGGGSGSSKRMVAVNIHTLLNATSLGGTPGTAGAAGGDGINVWSDSNAYDATQQRAGIFDVTSDAHTNMVIGATSTIDQHSSGGVDRTRQDVAVGYWSEIIAGNRLTPSDLSQVNNPTNFVAKTWQHGTSASIGGQATGYAVKNWGCTNVHTAGTYTVTASSPLIASTSHGLGRGNVVRVTNSGGSVPGGLATGIDYYVVQVGAQGTLSNDNSGFNVANGEQVTIGSATYTFKTTLTPFEGEVLIGANADASLLNLTRAINHSDNNISSPLYKCANANSDVRASASITSHGFTVTAIIPGTAGNSIATTDTSARLNWASTTLTGGYDDANNFQLATTTEGTPIVPSTTGSGTQNWTHDSCPSVVAGLDIDNSISIGVYENYAIRSKSTAPSVLFGPLTVSGANVTANNVSPGYASQATISGTTALTVASAGIQEFTGTTSGQIVQLPDVTTLNTGHQFLIINSSNQTVTVKSSGSNTVAILAASGNTSVRLTCILTTGTSGSSWRAGVFNTIYSLGKYLQVQNSFQIKGTDGSLLEFGSHGLDLSTAAVGAVAIIDSVTNSLIGLNPGTAGQSLITNGSSFNPSFSDQLRITKIINQTSNGVLKTSGSDGTLSVDTGTYVRSDMLTVEQALGSAILAQKFPMDRITTSVSMIDGQARFDAVYIPATTNITGVKWWQANPGSYTADNNNYIALYSYSAGTLTQVAISTNDGNVWQTGSTTQMRNAAFTTCTGGCPYVAAPGVYYIATLYNSSSGTAATLGSTTQYGSVAITQLDFTNSAMTQGTLSGQTALTTPITISTLTTVQAQPWSSLY